MLFLRKIALVETDDEQGHRDYEALERLEDAWAQIASEDHRIRYGLLSMPYGDPDWERLFQLGRELCKERAVDIGHDSLEVRYDDADLAQAELLSVLIPEQLPLSRREFQRAVRIRETEDGRSYADQLHPFVLNLARWRHDFGRISHDDHPLGMIVSSRLRGLLEKHKEEVSFDPVIDAKTGQPSSGFFQLQIKRRIPVDARTKLIYELSEYDGRKYPGEFLGFYRDSRDQELYIHRKDYRGEPVFLTEHSLGPHRWLNDARRTLVVSAAFARDYAAEGMTEEPFIPAYLVDDDTPPVWGGTLIFDQEKFMNGTYADWFEAHFTALEPLLGKADERIWNAGVPLHLSGDSSVLVFRSYVDGVAYVTCDLIGLSDQQPNSLGQYELMICTRQEEEWAPELISRLARATVEDVLEVGDTMDIGPALPEGSTIAALLFTKPDLPQETFTIRGVKGGILLCVGITEDELRLCRAGQTERVLAELRRTGVFPFTDLQRRSISLPS
jgi:hypothetical protein